MASLSIAHLFLNTFGGLKYD